MLNLRTQQQVISIEKQAKQEIHSVMAYDVEAV